MRTNLVGRKFTLFKGKMYILVVCSNMEDVKIFLHKYSFKQSDIIKENEDDLEHEDLREFDTQLGEEDGDLEDDYSSEENDELIEDDEEQEEESL